MLQLNCCNVAIKWYLWDIITHHFVITHHFITQLIFPSLKFNHVTPVLRQLHWLKVRERIDFKLVVADWHDTIADLILYSGLDSCQFMIIIITSTYY